LKEYKNINFFLLGAGLQSQARLPQYRETIKKACLQGIKLLNNGKNASEAACIAVAVLEVDFKIIFILLNSSLP
jgi:isoaspartyl peptidase/L-asparaginase-like protein (Ntn-hydrolase superfamily)